MPQFEVVPVSDAVQRTTRTRRGRMEQEYLSYIAQVGGDQAGKLVPSSGETALAVRRRLNAAAKTSGKNLKIVRAGDEVYFWVDAPARRRGRPRRSPQ